jgi:hypothetical protein
MIYGEVYHIYCSLQDHFHQSALIKIVHERALVVVEEPNLLQDSKKEEGEDAHRRELTTTNGMDMVSMWTHLDEYAPLFCDSYQILCEHCMADVTLLFHVKMLLKNS